MAALREQIEKPRLLLPQHEVPTQGTDELGTRRAQTLASQAERRRQLAVVEQALSALEHERAKLAAIQQQVNEARRTKEQLAQASRELEEEIQRPKEQGAELQTRYAALDRATMKGLITSGALRDADCVQCQASGVTIMPANLTLGVFPSPNEQEPLLAQARAQGGIIFLVRPDGFTTFETYRRVVEDPGATEPGKSIEMGWEPVDAAWRLKYIPWEDCTLVTYEEE